MANETQISYLHDMADELRAARHHIQQFNRLCEASGYIGDILQSPDDLQSRISQEINWMDVFFFLFYV